MKIAFIVDEYGRYSETFVSDLIEGLAGEGHDLRLFIDIPPNRPSAGGLKPWVSIGYIRKGHNRALWAERIGKLMKKPHSKAPMAIRTSAAERAFTGPLKQFKPDVAYVDYGPNAVLARRSLVKLGIPFVVHFHGKDASRLFADPGYVTEIQKVYHDAARIIVASHHVRRRLVLSGCPNERIELVRLGIDPHIVPPGDWIVRTKGPPAVLHLGRLTGKKNPLALLQAFKIVSDEIPEAILTIIGDGPLRGEVEDRVQQLGLTSKVSVTGALPRAEALKKMLDHWVFAQHSVTDANGDQEGFGVSMLEAACSGLPVVSTFHDGIPENVIDGVTGFLVHEFDYESMAIRVKGLLENPEQAESMGKNGRERVLEHYRLERRVEQILAILTAASARGEDA